MLRDLFCPDGNKHRYEFDHRYEVYNEPKAIERDVGRMTMPELEKSVDDQVSSLFSSRDVYICGRCEAKKEVTP